MYEDKDEMILVEADFEIIKGLTNRIDKLDVNLEKIIICNNIFISNMKIIENEEKEGDYNLKNDLDKNIETKSLNNKNILNKMNLSELKKICKDNNLKKYSNMKKTDLIDYIINNINMEILNIYLEKKINSH